MTDIQPMDSSVPFSTRKLYRSFYNIFWIFLVLMLFGQGCGLRPILSAPGSSETAVFLPPTMAPAQSLPDSQSNLTPEQATPTLPCDSNLTFVNDVTIPDGSNIQPGASLDKRWEVRNSGSCNWDERYSLRLIAGDQLGVNERLALFPARSGTNLMLRIKFQAPLQPGSYRSAWQAYDPSDEPFGDPIYIAIIVTD